MGFSRASKRTLDPCPTWAALRWKDEERVIEPYAPRDFDDQPPFRYAEYRSTVKRSPSRSPVAIVHSLSETTGPGPTVAELGAEDADLTTNAGTGGVALGPRTLITGRVLDESGRPVGQTLIEVWQANSAGRYVHERDDSSGPLDPNFLGVGQCLTNEDGRYRFLTVRPGPYPWRNHANAWRPSHIHLSIMGPALATRLVTQMYFPGDPLLALDPIFNAVPAHSRQRLVAVYDHDVTQENWALGYRFDIVLRGPRATPLAEPGPGAHRADP